MPPRTNTWWLCSFPSHSTVIKAKTTRGQTLPVKTVGPYGCMIYAEKRRIEEFRVTHRHTPLTMWDFITAHIMWRWVQIHVEQHVWYHVSPLGGGCTLKSSDICEDTRRSPPRVSYQASTSPGLFSWKKLNLSHVCSAFKQCTHLHGVSGAPYLSWA